LFVSKPAAKLQQILHICKYFTGKMRYAVEKEETGQKISG